MPQIPVNGVQLDYTISGRGPHLIQIPGAAIGKEGYAAVTPGLAEHYAVIDYDPRGYGGSDRPRQTYSLDVWVADIAALLDALGIERTRVHGGSMGSTVALRYASQHPDRVDGLVLSGCTAKSGNMAKAHYIVWKALARSEGMGSEALAAELAAKAVSRAFFDGPQGGPALIQALQEAVPRNVGVDVFCDACDLLTHVDVTADLPLVTAPTLVMVGSEDALTPADQGPDGAGGRYIYEHLRNARFKEFVEIAGSGHANLIDNPEISNRHLVDFLARVDAG